MPPYHGDFSLYPSSSKIMNGFDIFFILVLIAAAWKGWHSGVIQQALGLAGVFLGIYAARMLYAQVGYQLAPHIGTSPSIASIIAFILIWMGVPILLWALGSLLTQFLNWTGLGGINKSAGLVISVVKYILILGALCNVLAITKLVDDEARNNSVLFEPLRMTTSIAFDLAVSQWHAAKTQA